MKILLVVSLCFIFNHVRGLIIDLPEVIEVIEKDEVTVSCNVTEYTGNIEAVKFYWMKSMSIIQSEQILRIFSIEPEQSGTYTCFASNEGITYNSSVNIQVSYAPIWTEGVLRKFSGAIGSNTILNCAVNSYPTPLFTWITVDNITLTSSTSKYTINNMAYRSSLTINNLVQSDYGTYFCEASNKAGRRSYGIQLLMPGMPDSPQICVPVSIKGDSIVLTCIEGFNGGSDQLEYKIKTYTAANNLVPVSTTINQINTTSIMIEVKGLSPKQEYTLDIYASNNYGLSSEPFSLYFTTAPGTVVLTTGSPDNSKVVALAICIPLLVIAVVVASLVGMYKFHVKHKNAPQISETSSFHNALSNFPLTNRSHQRHDSFSKELILPQLSTTIKNPVANSYVNPAFTNEEPSNKFQPSLAGCGALEALKVIHPPAQLKFLPERSSSTNVQEANRNDNVRTTPPSISDSWEFPRRGFYLRKKLGDGSFGEMWEARIVSDHGEDGGRIVAIKMLRDNFTDDEQQSMLNDMKVMKSIGFHPNILQLIGCCTSSYPLCMILEYVSRGTLLNLLRQQRLSSGIRLTTKDVESFTLQIASAMEHATSLKILHRDLASRSILMTNDLVCKLSDFEPELHFQDNNNPHKRKSHRIQIRWLPPESLFVLEKSVKSNVWSFGILIWECFTLGSTPYPGMDNKEVVDFIQRGGRMPKPNFCSQAMYEVVQDCWIYYPHKRISFNELTRKIQKIYETSAVQDMDFATGEYDSKSWNANPQDLGEFV